MNTKRNQILNWHQQGHIKTQDLDKALSMSQSNNTPQQWYEFISRSMLWLGTLSIAVGVIFFFAYNWNEISTLMKFALLQGLMVITVIIYTQTNKYSSVSTASLFFLALLVGALLALFGQTYQTGKDPWQLFFMWMLVLVPLAYVSRSISLWLLWLVLANLTLNLLLNVNHGIFGLVFNNERYVLLYALLNGLSALLFEFLASSQINKLTSKVPAQFAIVVTMMALSWMAVVSIFNFNKYAFELFYYLLWMAAVYYLYRVKRLDVMILSSWVVSGIIFTVSLIGRGINHDLDGGTFLIFSLAIIGLSAMGGKWLMALLKEYNNKGEGE